MGNQNISPRTKKVITVILDVLTYLFFAICIFALVSSVVSKKNSDGAMSFFGKQMRLVLTNSMESCEQTDVSGFDIGEIKKDAIVFIELIPDDKAEAEKWYSELKKGDVLTFKYVYVTQETITHRVVEDPVKNSGGGYTIVLEGDNKASDADTLKQVIDTSLEESPNYIIGKVTGVNYPLGLFIKALKSPIGIVCIVIIPSLIIMVFEIFRLVSVLTEKKKKAEREKAEARENELEELKRRLAELELSNGRNDTEAPLPELVEEKNNNDN